MLARIRFSLSLEFSSTRSPDRPGGEAFQISKYAVTNARYAEFLIAVAGTDTNALLLAAERQEKILRSH